MFQSDALFSVRDKRNWPYDVIKIIQHLRLPENVFENFDAYGISNVNVSYMAFENIITDFPESKHVILDTKIMFYVYCELSRDVKL